MATVYAGFTEEFGFSSVNTVLNIPIGVQEMVLAVWLLAKGFHPSIVPLAASDAGGISRPGVPVFGAARVAGTD